VRAELPSDFAVLVAGGIAEAADVTRALEAGAAGAVSGTRFLLSDECPAHPEYKRRLLAANETILTELFGAGWPDAPHRVAPNAATDRWLGGDTRGPAGVRLLNRVSAPLVSRLPQRIATRLAKGQRPNVPIFAPAPPLRTGPATQIEAAPLYAGESVTRIAELRPAAELTRELAG
jgi:NAD(P)H-dependent flavin oxidoreductase YrpB (nitropropane dioxygenase family)